jgi:hypothetical protein
MRNLLKRARNEKHPCHEARVRGKLDKVSDVDTWDIRDYQRMSLRIGSSACRAETKPITVPANSRPTNFGSS